MAKKQNENCKSEISFSRKKEKTRKVKTNLK